MRVVSTSDLAEVLRNTNNDVKLWIYNAFDVMLPQEIIGEVGLKMNPYHKAVYDFERALQGPAFSMMQNGVKVDLLMLQRELKRAREEQKDLGSYVRSLALAVWKDGLNVNSPAQMKDFFYYDPAGYGLKPRFNGTGANRKVTCDRNA